MPKPTVFQTLLGRPSRSYADGPAPPPVAKDYHRVQPALARIAAEDGAALSRRGSTGSTRSRRSERARAVTMDDDPLHAGTGLSRVYASPLGSSAWNGAPVPTRPGSSIPTIVAPPPLLEYKVMVTPPSPVLPPDEQALKTSVPAPVPIHAPKPTIAGPPLLRRTSSSSTVASNDSAGDIFYTPQTSPHTSLALPSSTDPLSFSALAAALHNVAASPPSTRSTSPSTEGSSLFSHASLPSTAITSPLSVDDKASSYFAPVAYLKVPGVGPRVVPATSSSSPSHSTQPSRRVSPTPSRTNSTASTHSRAGSSRPRSRTSHGSSPALKKRMSAVYEESAEDLLSESTHTSHTHDPSRPLRRTSGRRAMRSRGSSASSVTVALPAPMPDDDGPAPAPTGYTTLVLPRAAYVPRSGAQVARSIAGGTVDLARAGLAQTTMATIEVVAGVAARRRGLRRRAEPPAPGEDADARTARAFAFTAHVAPPVHVPPHGVLVRVAAVGLDGVDARLAGTASVGWIPGRSVVGRVLEVGSAVREEHARKGEWAIGLLAAPRCGALAEFVVLDERAMHRVPRPASGGAGLTLAELALLPAVGVPALRAVRAAREPRTALVLHAHDGTGALAAALLTAGGCAVHAHDPHVRPALAELTALAAAGTTFDLVLDAAGGRALWAAARALLARGGLFVTTLGDAPGTPVPRAGAHFRAGMRALGGGGAYVWVGLGAAAPDGGDVRGALAALLEAGVRPVLPPRSRTLPFERAMDAFGPGEAGEVRMGGTAVVTIMDV